MNATIGILFAVGALIGWGLGDFSIQRATRAVGRIRALFYIGISGTVALLPFVWNEIVPAFSDSRNWLLMALVSIIIVVTALLNFHGLKVGKLSAVLPMNGVELVFAVLLAVVAGHERYSPTIYARMSLVFIGLALIGIVSLRDLRRMTWEKGVIYALVAAVGLGIMNFIVGVSSRNMSPLFTIWLTDVACAFATLIIILKRNHLERIRNDFRSHFNLITAQCVLDNLAWICFAFATVYIPIGIASAVSEGYLALGTLLGIIINRERLRPHQYAGMALTFLGILSLAYLTN